MGVKLKVVIKHSSNVPSLVGGVNLVLSNQQDSCCGNPISMNSVFSGFSLRKLCAIQCLILQMQRCVAARA
jgi:hypothetical protein